MGRLSWWTQQNHKGSYERRAEGGLPMVVREVMMEQEIGWVEARVHGPRNENPLEAGKGKLMHSLECPLEGTAPISLIRRIWTSEL